MNNLELVKERLQAEGRKVVGDIKLWAATYVNGILVEYNVAQKTAIKIGSGNSAADQEMLYNWVIANYGEDSIVKKIRKSNVTNFILDVSVDKYFEVVNHIENSEFELEQPVGSKVKRGEIPAFNVSKENTYVQIAKRIQFAVYNHDSGVLSRDLMDKLDDTIVIAQSLKHRDTDCKSWREHIVPCDFLYREGIEMYREGKPLYEIAAMLQHNLKIVMITDEEAKKLDGELGLKTDMPEGWVIGDSIFARLNFAGIEIVDL
jgi:hypothetical protein